MLKRHPTRNSIVALVCLAAVCTSCATMGGRAAAPPEPEPLPYGYVTSDYEQFSAQLVGDNGRFTLTGGTEKVGIPVGEYRLSACRFAAKDENGAMWEIVGNGATSRTVLEIRPGETTAVPFGPPLTASISASRRGGSLSLGINITGKGGETYQVSEFRQSGRRTAPPRFEVRNDKGEVIARGRFEYG